jgi:hypothetical protein
MTIEEARKLIPPGWLECGYKVWADAPGMHWRMRVTDGFVCAIPAPKPEPRRVPMGESEFTLDVDASTLSAKPTWIPMRLMEAPKWRLDPDAREWVEVQP